MHQMRGRAATATTLAATWDDGMPVVGWPPRGWRGNPLVSETGEHYWDPVGQELTLMLIAGRPAPHLSPVVTVKVNLSLPRRKDLRID